MFRIQIMQIEEVDTEKTEWHKIAETGNEDGGPVFAYVPVPGKHTKTVEIRILDQTVEDLDIVSVIKAVNKIE